MYYGLKIHYWWPLISYKNRIYIPSPYLIIDAVTISMLNRLTLNNVKLRRKIGKEVIEEYLYHIYKQLITVTWISREIEYKTHDGCQYTSDVLVCESEYCTFYDTKAMTPSQRIPKLDYSEIEKDLDIYGKNIIQIYKQISNYTNGFFPLDKTYDKQNIFGVVVMLDDVALPRQKIYEKSFQLYENKYHKLTDDEKNYIHSHVKIVSLDQIENIVLHGNSFLQCLINQSLDPNKWNDLNFAESINENDCINSYTDYVSDIKNRYTRFCTLSFQKHT